MLILDLPAEVLDHILYFGIQSRGLPRALRLKLVCKCFRTAFNRILFHTGVLDTCFSDTLFEHRHTRKYHGADSLWHGYLLHECRSPRPNTSGRFSAIRDTACALLQHYESQGEEGPCGPDLDTILDRLCWLALEGSTKASDLLWTEFDEVDARQNLLSAATLFGCDDLVDKLFDKSQSPTAHGLLPSPMYIAAWSGQAKLLQLMQENLTEFETVNIDLTRSRSQVRHHSMYGPGSLEGAAARGDVDMARLALYPPARTIPPPEVTDESNGVIIPKSILVLGERPGSVAPDSRLGCYISRAMGMARSPEVYEYLKSFLDPALITQRSKNADLAKKATAGDVVMIRHLLENGAEPTPKDTDIGGPPLMYAVRAWHEDVIDVMLEYGADINERGGFRRGTILTAAAKAGSISLLRKLLDAGAEVDLDKDGFTLWHAILAEHTGMVGMLLRMGVSSERGRRAKVVRARDRGLESMVELLEPWVMGGGPPEA